MRDGGGQAGPGAQATKRDVCRCAIEIDGMLRCPAGCGVAFFLAHRKFILGRETIGYRNHKTSDLVGQTPTQTILAIQIADHPTATVEVEQYGKRSAFLRTIYPERDVSHRAGNRAMFDAGNWLCLPWRRELCQGTLPCAHLHRGQVACQSEINRFQSL